MCHVSRWIRIFLLVVAGAWALTWLGSFTSQAIAQSKLPPLSLISIGTTVRNMDRSVNFYRDVLQFRKEYDVEFADSGYDHLTGIFGTRIRVVGMSLGPTRIQLTQFVTPRGRTAPKGYQSNDEWFHHFAIIVKDIKQGTRRLRKRGVRLVSPGPQWFPNGKAYLYFLDPDGHPLELAEFPGETLVNPSKLFQRIDHTAIVVRDLKESIDFYQRLGFRLEKRAESFSDVQQRLNNVFGAHLIIAVLRRPRDRIMLELLRYLTPRNGRPYPVNARPNDFFHRHLTFSTSAVEKVFRYFRESKKPLKSPEVATYQAGTLGKRRGFFTADPTGHPIEIVEK